MKHGRVPRKRPQQRRSQATVDAILDAAAPLFAKSGFANVTTNAVAERAGVSIGSLYQYFPNKLALLEALRERHVKGLWAAIGHACDEACALPWPAALRHVISACGAFNGRHVRLITTLHRELPIHSRGMPVMGLAQSTLQQHLRKFLEAHRDSIGVSIEEALFMMPALGRGIFTAAAADQPGSVENGKLVDDVVSVMLGYLSKERRGR